MFHRQPKMGGKSPRFRQRLSFRLSNWIGYSACLRCQGIPECRGSGASDYRGQRPSPLGWPELGGQSDPV